MAGDYHLVRDTHTTPAGQVIPLGLACRASLADYLEAADMFTLTKQGFDYYTQLFGAGYPFEKYDQVFVPEFAAGAMENVGCVTISERLLFRSKVTDMMYELRATVILHEMAHMWFGDLVTMKWWDDLWLNESFAEFSAALSSAEGTRFTDAWTTFSGSRKTWGYMQDQLPTTHPDRGDVPTLSEAIANFDGISYAKGASVLKQLVAHVGRDSFFAGIRAYFAGHGWGNATLSDLLGALEASSGLSLGDWAKAWLQTAGPNTLRSEFSVAPDGTFEAFAVLQEAAEEYPTLRPHHIAIGLYNRSADGAPGAHAPGRGGRRRPADGDRRAGRTAAAGPHPAQRRRPQLRHRPVRRAVAGHADGVHRGVHRLAGEDRRLERGAGHGAAGRALGARVRAHPGRRHG